MAERPGEVRRSGPRSADIRESTAREEPRERARGGDEVAAARAEIERTRAEMTETVDTIQDRLEPENLTENLKEQVTARTSESARNTGSELLEIVRQNPILATIVGAGIGLLILRRLRG